MVAVERFALRMPSSSIAAVPNLLVPARVDALNCPIADGLRIGEGAGGNRVDRFSGNEVFVSDYCILLSLQLIAL